MIVLLIVKLLCDFSYYFLFAHYFGSFSGIHYSLPLTMGVLVAAGALSGLLERRGNLRLVPAAAAFALLLQGRALADFIVLLPPLLYLLVICHKQLYWPDGEHANSYGDYLIACTHYRLLSGRSPLGLPAWGANFFDEENHAMFEDAEKTQLMLDADFCRAIQEAVDTVLP